MARNSANANPFTIPPEALHVAQLLTRMNEQLIQKRVNIVTIEDIYNLFIDERKAFYVIRNAIRNLPLAQRITVSELHEVHNSLAEDYVAIKAWEDKHTKDRERLLRITNFQERSLEARPNFRILKIRHRGKYIRFTISYPTTQAAPVKMAANRR